MPVFMLSVKDSVNANSYWVRAQDAEDARHLLALNIEAAKDAKDTEKFECAEDEQKTPPSGFIYRRFDGPVTIEKR